MAASSVEDLGDGGVVVGTEGVGGCGRVDVDDCKAAGEWTIVGNDAVWRVVLILAKFAKP